MKKIFLPVIAIAFLFSCKKKSDDPKPADNTVTYYVFSKSGKCTLYYKDGGVPKTVTLSGNSVTVTGEWYDSNQSATASNTEKTASDSIYISATRNGKVVSDKQGFKNSITTLSIDLTPLK